MECKYKKLFKSDGECDMTYPDCIKKVLCIYEDKYHELLQTCKDIEAILTEKGKDK